MNTDESSNAASSFGDKREVAAEVPPPSTVPPALRPLPFKSPAVVIGVTGNMDPLPDSVERIKKSLREFFRFLRATQPGEAKVPLPLAHPEFACGLEEWRGLDRKTPIVLLTSLARGVDCLVAEVALEPEFVGRNFHVQAPLPFPPADYREASTFHPKEASAEDVGKWIKAFNDVVDLIEKQNPEHLFPVLLEEDLELDEAGRLARFRADVTDSERSRMRYKAAGEYVAIQCDLLLAVWDDDYLDTSAEGTRAVVEAKRRGPTSELLPEHSALTWADVGTVFHLHARRQKSELKKIPRSSQREAMWRILHPYELGPSDHKVRDELAWIWEPSSLSDGTRRAFQKWQCAGNQRLVRIFALLAEFNRAAKPDEADVDKEMAKRAGTCGAKLQSGNPSAHAHLWRLCAAQRRAGDANRVLAGRKRLWLLLVFLLTLAAAMALHLFAHWHSQRPEEPRHHDWISTALAGGAFAMACFGLLIFWLARSGRGEERAHDYRALAEAIRVQFAWCLAGLGRSVSANYMQRQRGELDWIRTAVSSLTAPYPRWSTWFHKSNRAAQLEALECVHRSWIEEQAGYHSTTSLRRLNDLHFGHKLGGVLALAGLAHVAVHIAGLETDLFAVLRAHSTVCGGVAVGLLALLFVLRIGFFADEMRKRRSHTKPLWAASLASLIPAFKRLVSWLVRTPHSENQLDRGSRLRTMFWSFASHLPLSLVVLVIAICASVWLAANNNAWPKAEHLAIVSMGFCFVSGALAVAWTERNLHSEEAYQYNAMASLFGNGRLKMEHLLAELKSSLTSGQVAEFDRQVREAQALILALGKEALAENAEWLILHRARPMEPVMAG